VLVVFDSLSENGATRLMLDLADRFAGIGAVPAVFALQPVRTGREAATPVGVPLTRGVPVGGRLRRHGPVAALRLLRACRRASVVVSGSEVGLGLLSGYVSALLTRRPFVVVVHAPLDQTIEHWVPPALRRPTRRAHRHADAAICVSSKLVDGVTANGLEPRRVHVVRNAVDADRLRRLAATEPMPAPRLPVVVGVGRLSWEKGFDLLVRAHAELRREGVEHELELIGEGPELEPLRRLAAECGVADSVSLTGFVENAPARVARATALVVPSRHEGQPLVMLEALVLEVPVIASQSAGASEVTGPELVDEESVSSLVAALRRHLDDPEPLRSAARAGAASLSSRTLARAAREYLRILELTVGASGARHPKAAYE
jgi:glycosyltransferase involved in cell wall biosynthesis